MADFVISERAKKDLIGIANHTKEKWSEELAERYIRTLLTACGELIHKPLAGRPYDPIRPGLMGYPCGKHVIFYRAISNSKIRIIRVLHERMDYPRHIV